MKHDLYFVDKFRARTAQGTDLYENKRAAPNLGSLVTGWVTSCLSLLESTYGTESSFYVAFKKEFAKSYMQSISLSRPGSMSTPSGPDNIAFARLSGCLEIFKEAASDYEYEVKAQTQVTVSSRPDAHFIVEGIIQQFAGAVRQLARRHAGRPPFQIDDEYDVQDLLHAMLQLFFEDIRTEGAIVGTGGRALRIDFLLKEEQIGIEVKGPGLNHTGVIKQLNDDIAEYAKHLDCKTLFVLIYDPTHQVDNARGIEAEMSSDESKMKVKVFVVPR